MFRFVPAGVAGKIRFLLERLGWLTMAWLLVGTITIPHVAADEQAAKQRDTSQSSQHDTHLEAHWAYRGIDGPGHWAMLSPGYLVCEAGSQQSPINIHMPQHMGTQENLVFHYQPTPAHVANNGHTIQVDYRSHSVLHVNNRAYHLRQFHFHAPSEHQIEGMTYPMELHLVHQDSRGHIVVVGVFMTLGLKNLWLARLWDWMPKSVEEVSTPLTLNVADVLPSNTHHYTYRGSLTTPPCTEGVQWILLKEPIPISDEQRQQFIKIIGENARPIQPLHEGQVEEY